MNLNDDNLHYPRPKPIRPTVHIQAPGANVRLLGLGCALPGSRAATVLWDAVQNDMEAKRQAQVTEGILVAIRRAIGEAK